MICLYYVKGALLADFPQTPESEANDVRDRAKALPRDKIRIGSLRPMDYDTFYFFDDGPTRVQAGRVKVYIIPCLGDPTEYLKVPPC
jgi:hypothetical protein